MTSNTYFVTMSADQIIWLSHYLAKLPINGPLCDIAALEITANLLDILYFIWLIQHGHPATRQDAKEATTDKQHMIHYLGDTIIDYPKPTIFATPPAAVKPGIQKRLFSQVSRIKANIKYNEAIDEDLGIVKLTHTLSYENSY